MRRFQLHRDHDVSGVSGEGVVAEGVLWSDGWATTHWLGEHSSTVTWHRPGMESPEHVHGHVGATRFVMLDEDPGKALVAAEASGYARAVAILRDEERYGNWWTSTDVQPIGTVRQHLADYLETVGPDGPDVTKPQPEERRCEKCHQPWCPQKEARPAPKQDAEPPKIRSVIQGVRVSRPDERRAADPDRPIRLEIAGVAYADLNVDEAWEIAKRLVGETLMREAAPKLATGGRVSDIPVTLHFDPPQPIVRYVPVPYDPRTGRPL